MTTGGWGRRTAAGIVCLAVVGSTDRSADAQDTSALTIEGSFRSSLEADDNPGLDANSAGTRTRFDNVLSFDVQYDRPVSTLRLSFGANLRFEDVPSGTAENGIQRPFVNLNYNLEGPNSELDVTGRYRTVDVDSSALIDLDNDLIADTLATSEGQLETTRLGLSYSYGGQAPLGLGFSYNLDQRDYSDTIDPDLFDRTIHTYRATVSARLIDTARARFFVSHRDYEADDTEGTERTTDSYGVGLRYEIRPDLRFDGEVFRSEINATTETPVTSSTTDGFGFDFGVTKDLPNGTVGLRGGRTVRSTNTRTDLLVNRAMELPGGSLDYSVGVSDSDTGDLVLVGGLNYFRDLPDGAFRASLDITANNDSDDNEVQTTRLGLDWRKELTAVSNLDVGLDLARVADAGLGNTNEATRTDLSVTYSRQLLEDWRWSLGYRHRILKEEGQDTANSNVFLTSISHDFSIRP